MEVAQTVYDIVAHCGIKNIGEYVFTIVSQLFIVGLEEPYLYIPLKLQRQLIRIEGEVLFFHHNFILTMKQISYHGLTIVKRNLSLVYRLKRQIIIYNP